MSLDTTDRLWTVLWASGDPVPTERLAQWLEVEAAEVPRVAAALEQRLRETPFEVRAVAGGWALATRAEATRFLDDVAGRRGPESLSPAAWETLAVVAWRQPITRLEIDALRQVSSEHALDTLVARGLVEQVGRRETVGRPILYGTTQEFLRQFGLNGLDELPPGPDAPGAAPPSPPRAGAEDGGPASDR
jgi:segregation and condensation protein B